MPRSPTTYSSFASTAPKAVGCQMSYTDVTFESGFQPSIDKIKAAIKPNTRLVSKALDRFVAITKRKGIILLEDETYRDIAYGETLHVAESLGGQARSVSSLSKSFGIPGIRIGWLITTNWELQETLLAAKEQISITQIKSSELRVQRRLLHHSFSHLE
ncbi:HTH-type transcriptional regulator yisV [Penicillium frequentans]|nr:HTH-type transcriptional regulator yisV [Penicillium glabrum]